ncbi:MAG: SRPBCC family protein [Proteobacteria bacterium]|nr:SRPBCC family protein [Pseudomonadota bacterium]
MPGTEEQTYAFERRHDILVTAEPGQILDYVSNPNSWPEWITASHHIESADRPLVKGDSFRELWHTKTGEAVLNWRVTDSAPGRLWIGETQTPFLGKIIVRYDVERVGGQTRFTRTLLNPARPKPVTPQMIAAIDQEAKASLENIKRNVENKEFIGG